MLLRRSWVNAALCLVLCSNIVRAGSLELLRRDDASSTTEAATTTAQDKTSDQPTTTAHASTGESQTSSAISTSVTVASSISTTSAAAATAVPSALNGNTFSNSSSTYSNSTIEEGELPIEPQLTPGWGVAGVILLIAGVIYALIGIKNHWLHTFLSTAFLAGLCTAVLIVYVMTPPISNGVQAGYVVACICVGAVLGGGSTFFRDITEGIGCLLGGFCLSMWLLTLREGGLLPDNTGKIIFITVFTLVGFALYFSRYTRGYALIWSISFSGATATVLGIDCFSRAGYKEFWAYIWGINDNLFPLGADTYPLTKGMRVEMALVIIICIVGIISQLKLWRVIEEHRAKRAEARAVEQQQRDVEEAAVGQQIEEHDARERQQWEATYGGNTRGSVISSSKDSGIGSVNEKKGRFSRTTVRQASGESDEIMEMNELPPGGPLNAQIAPADEFVEIDLADTNKEANIVVQLAEKTGNVADLDDPTPATQDKIWVVGADGEARPASVASNRNSQRFSRSTAPEIMPLPFQIPQTGGDEEHNDDRSSFATFADDDDRSITLNKRASRASLGNRLSVGSEHLLRSISRGSMKSSHSKRKTGEFSPTGLSHAWTGSQEDLVSVAHADYDGGSVAATIDRLSIEEEKATGESSFAMEITAELNNRASLAGSSQSERSETPLKSPLSAKFLAPGPYSTAETAGTGVSNALAIGDSAGSGSKRNSSVSNGVQLAGPSENGQASDTKMTMPKKSPAADPSTTSTPPSLTKDHLPNGLSRVASTYRTNEWAKHLSQAEAPEPEQLSLSQDIPEEEAAQDSETAAPVKLEELKQTAENATPAPARSPSSASQSPPTLGSIPRSNSSVSIAKGKGLTISTSPSAELTARNSSVKKSAPPSVHATRGFQRSAGSSMQRNSDLNVETIAEEQTGVLNTNPPTSPDGLGSGQVSPASTDYLQPGPRPPVSGVVSYASPQTLLGKREMLLRNKSSILGPTNSDQRILTPQPSASDVGSIRNYPSYNSLVGEDADDMPLSQRKQLIRQSSVLSSGAAGGLRPKSNTGTPYGLSQTMAETSKFNSHQPARSSTLPSQREREAQLASFRNSVAKDIHVATPPTNNFGGRSSRDFLPSQVAATLTNEGLSAADVQRNLDQSRNMLLNQRGQETQRKEMERLQKERNDRVFEEGMRSNPQLMDAHRDAMRRLQSSAR
ncbi:hypothetical protein SCUP515_02874 [Seiridium cupressi]